MRWLRRNVWKAGIAIVGMLLLLVFMVWVPVSAASLHEMRSGLVTPVTGTVQATPTMDPTMTALQKEQLALQTTSSRATTPGLGFPLLVPFLVLSLLSVLFSSVFS